MTNWDTRNGSRGGVVQQFPATNRTYNVDHPSKALAHGPDLTGPDPTGLTGLTETTGYAGPETLALQHKGPFCPFLGHLEKSLVLLGFWPYAK